MVEMGRQGCISPRRLKWLLRIRVGSEKGEGRKAKGERRREKGEGRKWGISDGWEMMLRCGLGCGLVITNDHGS